MHHHLLSADLLRMFLEHTTNPNTCTLGRIRKHNIVIACLSKGQYGTCAATTVANHMIRTFSKSLRIGLMVGVGGEIPSADHYIQLGDIVISCPADTCGGVIQYYMGKSVQVVSFVELVL